MHPQNLTILTTTVTFLSLRLQKRRAFGTKISCPLPGLTRSTSSRDPIFISFLKFSLYPGCFQDQNGSSRFFLPSHLCLYPSFGCLLFLSSKSLLHHLPHSNLIAVPSITTRYEEYGRVTEQVHYFSLTTTMWLYRETCSVS